MQTILLYLPRLFEVFRFIKRSRERKALEKQAERDHMVDLMDTMLARVERIVEHQATSSQAQAAATAKLAEPLAEWLQLLKQSNDNTAHLTTATVRSSDEVTIEEERERQRLIAKGFPLDKTDAEKLQWLIDNEEL